MSKRPAAVIFGCSDTVLTPQEQAFFKKTQPLGFILFARNCDNLEQIKVLVSALKSCVSHRNVPVLIDQEGGRVARLKPPQWRAYPPAERFTDMARLNPEAAARACYLNARLIAHDLATLGINTDCAPVADLRLDGAHDIIGDRAFGASAAEIAPLARAQANGLMEGGVIPVLKHIPGHGRALVDSHEDLPVVEADRATLEADFAPFKELASLPMAMTAHIRYNAIDPAEPATLSPAAIALIRNEIGFDGLLMTDDMSMKALKGDIGDNAARAIAAGCDIALHCNGKMDEMEAIAAKVPLLSEEAVRRTQAAFAMISPPPADHHAVLAELSRLMPEYQAA